MSRLARGQVRVTSLGSKIAIGDRSSELEGLMPV